MSPTSRASSADAGAVPCGVPPRCGERPGPLHPQLQVVLDRVADGAVALEGRALVAIAASGRGPWPWRRAARAQGGRRRTSPRPWNVYAARTCIERASSKPRRGVLEVVPTTWAADGLAEELVADLDRDGGVEQVAPNADELGGRRRRAAIEGEGGGAGDLLALATRSAGRAQATEKSRRAPSTEGCAVSVTRRRARLQRGSRRRALEEEIGAVGEGDVRRPWVIQGRRPAPPRRIRDAGATGRGSRQRRGRRLHAGAARPTAGRLRERLRRGGAPRPPPGWGARSSSPMPSPPSASGTLIPAMPSSASLARGRGRGPRDRPRPRTTAGGQCFRGGPARCRGTICSRLSEERIGHLRSRPGCARPPRSAGSRWCSRSGPASANSYPFIHAPPSTAPGPGDELGVRAQEIERDLVHADVELGRRAC